MSADDDTRRHGLFVTDAELIRRLGLSPPAGKVLLSELDCNRRDRRRFPHRDPLFGRLRYWPAVVQWLNDYFGVRSAVPAKAADLPNRGVENLEALRAFRGKRKLVPRIPPPDSPRKP
jgi:hypothetical protein